jgi:HSP20 family protein
VEVEAMLVRNPDEPLWLAGVMATPPSGTWSRPAPIPADAYQDGEDLVVMFDLPGVEPEAITIDTTGATVTVSAERRPPDLGPGAALRQSERALGVFRREVRCNRPVDTAQILTHYHHGVLTMRIRPTGDHPTQRITVSAAEAETVPVAAAA